ncbi:MAG: 2OG-Fe(II) oxygenase [Verrucomicrobia bacterium]|nr:2OG-Fe(II) oxygenase [Verrucomicrobiota bacterium]
MNASESFLSAFSEITGTGNFHSTGAAPFFFPGLCVKGLGEIAFPLHESQVKEIIALAEVAPYGKGTRTVLDESIRKCWQLDASCFSFDSPQWKKFLKQTLSTIREDLGIKGKISASPYKLLLYGKGGHFKAHKDTEKLEAMFGTLVIALPSKHEGGRLYIRHDGREIKVDFSSEQHRHDFQHAAFFADCEHEVEPVRSGYRCCVVYNLRLDEGDPGVLNLSLTAHARALLPALAALKQEGAGKLRAVLLDHSYTEANLSLRNLKGNDQARAHALLAAAEEAGCTAHLALVTFHQTGQLEDDDYAYRRRRRYDDDDDAPVTGAMGEIYDEDLTIAHWRDQRDRKVELGSYRVDPDTLITKEKFGEGDPDEQESEGYTGNAGCTMDYWYRRAAIVLWAAEDQERILCQYNFRGACTMLEKLAAAKHTGPGSPFHRLATEAVASYPEALPHLGDHAVYQDFSGDPLRLLLAALAKTGSRNLLDRLLKDLPSSACLICDAPLWSTLYQAFGLEPFDATCKTLLGENLEAHRRPLFQILGALSTRQDAAARVQTIAARLATLAPKKAPAYSWTEKRDPQPVGDREETQILLAASHLLVNAKDRQAARAFLQADSSLPYLREILGPALLHQATAKHLKLPTSLAPAILTFAKDLLAAEVQRPLPPYPDWTRPCPSPEPAKPSPYYRPPASGKPDPIHELVAFMADPDAKTHNFAHPQDERSQLEDYIRRHFLDLDHVTIRTGRPHTLACTKNDQSHQHALALRAKDVELLKKLDKLRC